MQTVKIKELVSFVRGVSYKKEQASKEKQDQYTAILRANNINEGDFNFDDLVFVPSDLILDRQMIKKGDIVITMSSGSKAHVGKVAIATHNINAAFGAFCAKIVPEKIVPQYLYYLLRSTGFRRHIEIASKGTNINNIKQDYILDYEICLPSHEEQKSIVAKIEELFSELDNGVETLKKTKQQLAVYHQAVLKEAFASASKYETGTIQSVCSNIVDCPHSTPKWVDTGKICLRTTNFKRGYLDLSEKNYVSDETFNKRNARLVPQPGDVLYSREGAILGIACIIPKELFVCLGQRMMLLRTNEKMLGQFLMHYLNSPKVTSYVNTKVGGSASPHINVGDIKEFVVPIPPISEQQKILEQIESRMSVCDNIENTVDTALQQAEAMRQSILKKAFEGGL